jgi:hypothetical protein
MLPTLSQTNFEMILSDCRLILKYEGEDEAAFLVSGCDRARLSVLKNRHIPKMQSDQAAQAFKPVFRLIALAFLGLAPAGLGTLVLAPLAALWALTLAVSQPFSRENTIRVAIAWALAAGLLALAIPLSKLFLARIA